MSKPFDATLKTLVQNHPEDWLAQAGLPFEGQIDVIDADLSTVTTAADKIIRVHAPRPCLLHVELQADEDEHLDTRVLKYNVLQFVQHNLSVHSLVVLLRSAADDPKLTGTLRCPSPLGGDTLVFHYQVIRVWLEPPGTFLNGGLGLLPLATVSNVTKEELSGVIRQMSDRLQQEADPEEAKTIWTSAYILAGLRYSSKTVQQLFQGVISMRESSTYQAILKEGRDEGHVEGIKHTLMVLGEKRFGKPTTKTRRAFQAIVDATRLDYLTDRVLDVNTWDELLAS